MRSESVCVSLENGRATATMTIRMPMLSLSQARPFCRNGLSLKLSKIARFCKKRTPASAGVGWLEAVPGVEHGDKGLAGPTP